jgi:transposase
VPLCLIGIEAGMATHYLARELIALGHDVRQVPPVYARPFRQTHKNDFRDAYAIAEAVRRPSTRCVPVKTDDQLDLQALHRVRSRLISERTAVINQIRGFLLERAFRSVKAFASFVSSSQRFWPNATTSSHPG